MGFILPLSMVDTHSLLEAVERAATPTNSNQIRKIVSNTNNAFITYIFPRAPKSALPCACNTCDATAPETFSTNTHTYRTKLLFKQNNPILLWFRYESKKESSCLLHLICIDLFIIWRAGIHMQSGANSFRSHSIWMCVCVCVDVDVDARSTRDYLYESHAHTSDRIHIAPKFFVSIRWVCTQFWGRTPKFMRAFASFAWEKFVHHFCKPAVFYHGCSERNNQTNTEENFGNIFSLLLVRAVIRQSVS